MRATRAEIVSTAVVLALAVLGIVALWPRAEPAAPGAGPPAAATDADLAPLRAAAGLAPCPSPSGGQAAGPLTGVAVPCLGAPGTVDLGAALAGRPALLNVWASWCAPCRAETPLLERTWRSNPQDVVIVGVASKDTPGPAAEFMGEFDVTFSNILDETGDIRRRLGLRGFPTTYVFDTDGRLRTTVVGGLTEPRLASILQDLQP